MVAVAVRAAHSRHAPIALDDSDVRHQRVREVLAESLRDIGLEFRAYRHFWRHFPRGADELPSRVLVVADLSRLAQRLDHADDRRAWLVAARRRNVAFLGLVRTRADERCVGALGALMQYTDSRLVVCTNTAAASVRSSLRDVVSAREPHSLSTVRCSPHQGALWVEFGDGLSGSLTFQQLGVAALSESFILDSVTVGESGAAIEIQQRSGEVFEIDVRAVRAMLDSRVHQVVDDRAHSTQQRVGAQIRRARLAAGLSQMQLHHLTGIDQALISKLERGLHEPRVDTIQRIANAFGVDAGELLTQRGA